jgi:pectin methylesterase-like acyl-CoA thioesterase
VTIYLVILSIGVVVGVASRSSAFVFGAHRVVKRVGQGHNVQGAVAVAVAVEGDKKTTSNIQLTCVKSIFHSRRAMSEDEEPQIIVIAERHLGLGKFAAQSVDGALDAWAM